MIVCGAGTGGTVAGIGRKIKEQLPTCKVRRGWTQGEREREREREREGERSLAYHIGWLPIRTCTCTMHMYMYRYLHVHVLVHVASGHSH
jgi:hypothetical protein